MHKHTYKVQNSIVALQDSEDYVACEYLTVITLTYNNFDQLEETLESIKSVRPKEVLVINGGQCTKTLDYLNSKAEYFKEYFELRHISEPDKGIYDGINKGIKNATGRYINFLNSGDRVCDPQYFKFAIDILNLNPHIGYTHADVVLGNEKQGYHQLGKRHMLYLYISKKNYAVMPCHQTMVYRLGIFSEVGIFDTKYKIISDLDHYIRMYKKAIKPHYLDFISIVFDDGGISSSNLFSILIELIRLFKSNKTIFVNRKKLISYFLSATRHSRIFSATKHSCILIKNNIITLLLLGLKNIKYDVEPNEKHTEILGDRHIDINSLLEKIPIGKIKQLSNLEKQQ